LLDASFAVAPEALVKSFAQSFMSELAILFAAMLTIRLIAVQPLTMPPS
jgi:hypothetical protein